MSLKRIGDGVDRVQLNWKQIVTGVGMFMEGDKRSLGWLGRGWSGKDCATEESVRMLSKKAKCLHNNVCVTYETFSKIPVSKTTFKPIM